MPVAPLRSIVPRRRLFAALLLAGVCGVATAYALEAASSTAPIVRVSAPPPTATRGCADAIAGVWVANEHRSEYSDWLEHTIHIVNDDGVYTVEHVARTRAGDARGPAKLDCTPDAMVFETLGRATLDGDRLHVWGTSLRSARAACDGSTATYSLDSWTGTVAGNTFDSVNNDGSTAVNRPYRFHRIACE